MAEPPLPELYFATVRAMGTDLSSTVEHLSTTLTTAGYHVPEKVRLSSELRELDLCKRFLAPEESSEYSRRNGLMTAGDAVRTFVAPDAVALLGIRMLKQVRAAETKVARRQGMRGIAWIMQSLMHEAEVSTLRDLLGDHFFLISVFSDEARRKEVTRRQLGPSQNIEDLALDDQVADIHARDQGRDYRFVDRLKDPQLQAMPAVARLSIEDTFFNADLFLDGDRDVRRDIERFVKQLFGNPFGVASREEVGMAHAFTASQQSAAIGRRVGASLTVDDSLICTGRNDLPRAGGGQQDSEMAFADADEDPASPIQAAKASRRRQEAAASEAERADIVRDLLTRLLKSAEWRAHLSDHLPGQGSEEVVDLEGLLDKTLRMGTVRDSRVYDLIEFDPTVHAEMSAVSTAARMGFSVSGGVLYTTTFPCHECTRHIISSGVRSVVYLEPYAKSRAEKLFADQIRLSRGVGGLLSGEAAEPSPTTSPVDYFPFMGIAPRRQPQLFSWLERKNKDGSLVPYVLDANTSIRKSIEAPIPPDRAHARVKAKLRDQNLAIEALEVDLTRGRAAINAMFSRARSGPRSKVR